MPSQSSPVPEPEVLRALARMQGVEPSDEDLEAVAGFLASILPELPAIEVRLARSDVPAGPFLPEDP
ncbi:MAG TPA: hypothetical protein VFO26_01255 [Gaiella sp.]|jgi:hypothetical protein|uniref:hypothetical protein n=1 Tax=Gaiella sp. TaxID=2663207 RepID=UPI002D80EB8A|nr:hypothetical protein [Gaiella sp.]HET9286158.1 hypothetical protein [Gaiella sp.]